MKKRTKKEIKRCLTGIVTASLIISSVHIGTFALAAKKTSIAKSAKVTVGKTVRVKLKNNKKSVKWKVSKGKKYVKITKKSKTGCTVKGLKKGSAKVQAVIGKKKYSCKITVAAKKTTKKPATIKKPVTTKKPVATAKPTATTKPTASSDVTVKPSVTETPKVTNTPSATSASTVTETPTVAPVVTAAPTVAPTKKTEPEVTLVPTVKPTKKPTVKPTVKPTKKPTGITWYYNGESDECYDKTYNLVIENDSDLTELKDEQFCGFKHMVSITISKNVTKIGKGVFDNCELLKKITVDPENKYFDSRDNCNAIVEKSTDSIVAGCAGTVITDSIKYIKAGAFLGTKVEKMIIPDNVKEIGEEAFRDCNRLYKVSIPGSTIIGESAFYSCSVLNDVEIKEGNAEIKEGAFWDCNALKKIVLPKGKTIVSDYMFSECTSLQSVTFDDDIKSIGEEAFSCTAFTEFNIPDTVESVGKMCFRECEKLKKVTLSKGIKCNGDKTILSGVFSGCISLEEITIPQNINYIGDDMFSACDKLTTVNIENKNTDIGSRAFAGCVSIKDFEFSKGSIGKEAFWDCTGFENIDISNTTALEDRAFMNCTNLKNVTASSNLKKIGVEAFEGCGKMPQFIIPDGVTNIESNAFADCVSLREIAIPASVTNIGTSILFNTKSLEKITVDEKNECFYCGEGVNAIITKKEIKGVVDENEEHYNEDHDAYVLIAACKNTVIPDTVKKIDDFAFYQMTGLSEISIPSGVTRIGDEAFYGCTSLKNINIPDTVSKIGVNAFAGCNALEEMTVDEENEYYYSEEGSNAIIAKKEIKFDSIYDFEQIDNEPHELVYGCKTTVIPASVTKIGYMAFNNLSTLTKINIPDAVQVDKNSFWNCENLTSITWKGTVYKSVSAFYKAYNPGMYDDDDVE